MGEKNDWIDIRLTKFGEEYAAGSPLRVQEGNGGQGFVFSAGETQRVTRAFDWERVLKPWHINGHALFEYVPTVEQAADVDRLAKLGIAAEAEPGEIDVEVGNVEEVQGKMINLIFRVLNWLLLRMALFVFEPQDVLDIRNLALGPNKQNTFLTPMAAASYTYRPRNPGNYNAGHPPTFYSDEQLANKGHQWPTRKARTMEETSFDATMDLDNFLAGWVLFFLMGSETVTGTGPWTHTFKFLQSTNQMPVTTLLLQDTNDVIYQFPDMAILDLVISGTSSGPLQVQWKMVGSGKKVDGAITLPVLGLPLFLFGSDTDIKIGPSAPDMNDPNQQFTLSTTVLGAQAQHTTFYKFTYVDAAGETIASQEISILVPANSVSKATMPATLPPGVTGVNVYASTTTGH